MTEEYSNPLTFCRWGQVYQVMNRFEDDSRHNLLKQMQGDLPAEKRPFRAIASQAGTSEKRVLDTLRSLIQQGRIRKFGALLRHQKAGVTRNAMVVWAVPPERAEEAGRVFASFREITHCYERRPPFQGRYNLFTMIHTGKGALEELIGTISSKAGIGDYQVLESLEEFKKISMEYY
jgi:DNA-binding Lrp family transcriptional regulator